MVRYIHLNPVRAGVCATIEQLDIYPWTGHSVLVGSRVWQIQNTADVLKRFDGKKGVAREMYRRYLKNGLDQEPEIYSILRKTNDQSENMHNTGSWVIGNKEFVSRVMAADNAKRTRIARYIKEGVSIEKIAEKKAKEFGLAEGEIMKRGKNNSRSEARKACAYVLNRLYEIPVIQFARYFNISSPAASTMIAEGEKAVKNGPQ
jgi:hypothetical protein